MVFLSFLKFRIADLATPDWRERRLLENCFAAARMSSRYFAATTRSYSQQVSSAESSAPAFANMDGSGPPAQRVDASLPMEWNSPAPTCLRVRTVKEKTMRFMMIMFPGGYEEAKPGTVPDLKDIETMRKYNEQLRKDGFRKFGPAPYLEKFGN